MLSELIAVLRKANPDISASEIADVLWLVGYLGMSNNENHGNIDVNFPELSECLPDQSITPPPVPKEEKPISQEQQAIQENAVQMHLSPDGASSSSEGMPARPERISSPVALSERLSITRSLRPYMKRSLSRMKHVLDEEQTVRLIADQQIWTVALKPAICRWYELDIIVDRWSTMVLWEQTVSELFQLLEGLGAFRKVNLWSLFCDSASGQISLHAGLINYPSGHFQCNPLELINSVGKRIALVVSDCISPAWQFGEIRTFLEFLGHKGQVSLLQVLPPHLWKKTGLRRSFKILLEPKILPGYNNKFAFSQTAIEQNLLSENPVGIPIFTLEEESIHHWAQVMTGERQERLQGIVLPNKEIYSTFLVDKRNGKETSPESLVDNFRVSASPVAWKLAVSLSAVPLSMPIIRLVQRSMGAKNYHLVEVLFGGLINSLPQNYIPVNLDEQQFDFLPGVRKELNESLTKSETAKIYANVWQFISQNNSETIDFPSLLANPSLDSEIRTDKNSLLFAQLAIPLLKRMGKNFRDLADRLEKIIPQTFIKYNDPVITTSDQEIVYKAPPAIEIPGHLVIALRVDNHGQLTSWFGKQILAGPFPVNTLPSIERLQADPSTQGQFLTDVLGGETWLIEHLSHSDNLLLLDCDDTADSFAWEFATGSDGQFLCVRVGMLRLVDRDAPVFSSNGPLHFVALAADPLVDGKGEPREGYRLDVDNELKAIRAALQECGKSLEAQRIPPTRAALNKALRKGPAILHLTCHGNVVATPSGPLAILSLEKEDGSLDPLTGADLIAMPPRGMLRMVLLSACMTASGTQANLVRALALSGVSMTVGMQNPFPDPLSDELAVALYDSLLAGLPFGEALRQARQSLARYPESVGLPVGYVARTGWDAPLALSVGVPDLVHLVRPGLARLGGALTAPRPLLGRNLELHQLAQLYARGEKVVTIAGSGGMGKSALAAAFAERFAWRWPQGVWAYSFAGEVNASAFLNASLRLLYNEDQARQLVVQPAERQREALLQAAAEWDGLWLLDNYESVMQTLTKSDAAEIHHIVVNLANGGATLLLTSREQPTGLRNEHLFPQGATLPGLGEEAGAELFLQHSVKAKEKPKEHVAFAREIQRAVAGHPLAIVLLAGEYDVSAVPPTEFLQNWQSELAAARRPGMAAHHVTFATAFERSFKYLSPAMQQALTALSIFPFPFFAEGYATVSGQVLVDPEALTNARQTLSELTRRSLLEVDGTYIDGTPAIWCFQPALREEAARRMDAASMEIQQKGYITYAAWFVSLAFAEIGRQPAIARLALAALSELIRLAGHQPEDSVARYDWQLGTILYQLGFMPESEQILAQGIGSLQAQRNEVWRERILFQQARINILHGYLDPALQTLEECARHTKAENNQGEYSTVISEMARIYITRGDLDRALALYQESLALKEQLGDKQGKAVSLSNMAQVYLTRGDLDRALALYQDSLALNEQLGDKQGKAVSLHQMANVYLTRGDLDRALALYQESLALDEQLGDKQGKAASLNQMAQVYLTRGDLDRALALYQESLALKEQLGDKQGKAVSLSTMAQVYLTRGDLDRTLALYQESLQLLEQMGDKKGKAVSLHGAANVFLIRGDLERAMQFYQESLQLFEQLGDIKGKAASLHGIGNVFFTRGDLERAPQLYQESLQFFEQLGDIKGKAVSLHGAANIFLTRSDLGRALQLYQESLHLKEQIADIQGRAISLSMIATIMISRQQWAEAEQMLETSARLSEMVGSRKDLAIALVKRGQLANIIGNRQAALEYCQRGLAVIEGMGIPELSQIRQIIVYIGGGEVTRENYIPGKAIQHLLLDAYRKDSITPLGAQHTIVKTTQEGQNKDSIFNNSIALYSLSPESLNREFLSREFLSQEFSSVQLIFNKVLESDDIQKYLEINLIHQVTTPNEPIDALHYDLKPQNVTISTTSELESQIQAHLAGLPPEQRPAAEAAIRKALAEFQRLTPDEQFAVLDTTRRTQVERAADQARDAALAYVRRQAPLRDVLIWLDKVARNSAEGEEPNSPWLDVSRLCFALAALIDGAPIPSVPARYATHFSAVQVALQEISSQNTPSTPLD